MSSSAAVSSYSIPFYWSATGADAKAYSWDVSDGAGGAYMAGRSIAEFQDVAGTLMVVEDISPKNMLDSNRMFTLAASGDGLAQSCLQYNTPGNEWSGCAKEISGMHFDGWNYLFLDGHVKWLKPERTVGTGTLSNPRGMWTIAADD
jgi:prepilin-type processing-associated H-X9-DG protein